MLKKIIRLLPRKTRQKLVRKMMPEINLDIEGVVVESVTGTERSECIELLNDVYVETGFITRDQASIRRVPQHRLMTTTVFAVKKHGDIIGTFSIFCDGIMGLPMDSSFEQNIQFLRDKNRIIVEIGCLAIKKEHRSGSMNIPFLINKTAILYAINNIGAHDIVLTTHPKFGIIYEYILLAKKIGHIKSFGYVNNNPAVAYWSDLKKLKKNMELEYDGAPKGKNIHHIIFGGLRPSYNGMVCENFYYGVSNALCHVSGKKCPAYYEEKYVPWTCPKLKEEALSTLERFV